MDNCCFWVVFTLFRVNWHSLVFSLFLHLESTRHVPPKRPYFFSLVFTERPPFLPTFTQWPPIFRKFRQLRRNVEKFLAILALKAPIFWCISLKDPIFLCTLSLKDPLFWRNLSPKDPYIWGAWWHSYVTFICECPPPVLFILFVNDIAKATSLSDIILFADDIVLLCTHPDIASKINFNKGRNEISHNNFILTC